MRQLGIIALLILSLMNSGNGFAASACGCSDETAAVQHTNASTNVTAKHCSESSDHESVHQDSNDEAPCNHDHCHCTCSFSPWIDQSDSRFSEPAGVERTVIVYDRFVHIFYPSSLLRPPSRT